MTTEASPTETVQNCTVTAFGLTDSEAAALDMLVHGRTLSEAGKALAIVRTTAKTHLQHIYSKTRLSRQTDLVALVLKHAPPVRIGVKDEKHSTEACSPFS
ncbi:MAG TPA: helix-turn-helix transcriptional regulator [Hyphomicrobiaceae bacterium]|nr:helix-turn-helix transcriptional regulator [Hyphomicrobiaceae bacterium]